MTFLVIVKWIHVLSAIILFGVGLGSVYYKTMADRSGRIETIFITNRHVVIADWIFTTPTIIIQPVSGFVLAYGYGYSPFSPWLQLSLGLYLLAGCCWLPVVFLQIRMRNHSKQCLQNHTELGPLYWRYANIWLLLGIPAFSAMIAIVYMMIAKPQF